jgi:fluoride exporter
LLKQQPERLKGIWQSKERLLKKYVFIGAGGFLGAISRYLIKNIYIFNAGNFPINTLIINVTGSFVLAFFLTIALSYIKIGESVRLGVSTGFLGAYTTFSTLCKESTELLLSAHYYTAISYIFMSVIFGLAAAILGTILAKRLCLEGETNQ